MTVRFFAYDTETTGLDPTEDAQIISLAYMALDTKLDCVAKGQWFVLPTVPVDPAAARVNGYTPELWGERGAITQDAFADELAAVWKSLDLRRALSLGQNVGFDYDFLRALGKTRPAFAKAMQDALSYHKVDTISLGVSIDHAHEIDGAFYKLGELAARWGVRLENAHDALADLEATVEVYRKFHELLKQAPRPPLPVPSGFLIWSAEGYRFRFGKFAGRLIIEADPGYLRWVLGNVTTLLPAERTAVQALVP